jgi:hypothetical protein
MRNNSVVIVVAALIVSYLLISPFAGDRAVGQQQAASAVGRYQMAVGQITVGNKELRNDIYVLDTQTGQLWQKSFGGRGNWTDWGSPTRKEKKE